MTGTEKNSTEAAKKWETDLISSHKYSFNGLNKFMLPGRPGVYSIFLNETDECLYVGQTTDIQKRIYRNHFMGNEKVSSLRRHIIRDLDNNHVNKDTDVRPWLESNCYCQYIEIIDDRERYHVEGLLGFLLNSKYIEKVSN